MFHVGQLTIIAGPSCAGKTFLIDKIRQNHCPRLIRQLGIENPCSCLYVLANRLRHISQPIIEQLVVHYDFYNQYSQETGFKHLHKLIVAFDM